MKTLYKYIFSVVLLFSSITTLTAETEIETMIFKAMGDEMARSMNELTYKDYAPPFYIAYFVHDMKNISIKASLGSVIESTSNNSVYCRYRLLVGSYQLNDEKFYDKVNKVSYNDGRFSPLEHPDYYGIRRCLWLLSNNSYKSASETYHNKCDLMEKEGLSVDDMKAPDFSKEPVVEYIGENLPHLKNQTFLEAYTKDISLSFANYTDIIESDVTIKCINQTNYMLNSEGSKTQIPTCFYCVVIKAKMLSQKNKPMSQVLKYYANSYDELPDKAEMKRDIEVLINNLYATKEAPEYQGKYQGPILIQDEAVFYKNIINLVYHGNGILAKPRGLVNDKNKGLALATNLTWEDMKGKRVLDKKMSVTALPTMTTYNGIPLIGTAICDNEGVMTPSKIELINNGILKNQLNNRTPMPSQLNSNGHKLPYYKNNMLTTQIGTSIIKITSNEVKPLDSLYISLKELAKEENLDYAIVIKPLKTNANYSPINTYKLDLETGEETLLSGTNYVSKISELRDIEALGNTQIVTNTLVPNQAALNNQMKRIANYPNWIKNLIMDQIGEEGSPSSFIYPNAMLIKSTTMNGSNDTSKSKKRVVPSPLVAQ